MRTCVATVVIVALSLGPPGRLGAQPAAPVAPAAIPDGPGSDESDAEVEGPVERVEIHGQLFDAPDALAHQLGLDPGARLDASLRRRVLEQLHATGYVARLIRYAASGRGVIARLALDPVIVDGAEITGHPLEPPATLANFLGLEAGAHLRRDRVVDGIRRLGYFGEAVYREVSGPTRVRVSLDLEPARVVRHIDVHGSWPIFRDEVRRRLSLRPGSLLPPGDQLSRLLKEDAEHVRDFLRRDGYFEAAVLVATKPGSRSHPQWVDLDVKVLLGRWTRIDGVDPEYLEPELDPRVPCDPSAKLPVCPTGYSCRLPGPGGAPACLRDRALTPSDLTNQFTPGWWRPSWWGRFRLDQMRDDARSAEQLARERGYPSAHVSARFDLDPDGARATIRPQVTQKGHVELHFEGNRSFRDPELREHITIFTSGSYDSSELGESARELHRFYQSKGYFEATVWPAAARAAPPTGPAPAPAVAPPTARAPTLDRDVTFQIDEGPEMRVRSVDVVPEVGTVGLTLDPASLRALLATKVFPRLGVLALTEGGYITSQQLAQDVERLEDYHRTLGFPEVHCRGEVARDASELGQVGVIAAELAARPRASQERVGSLAVRFYCDEGRRELVERVEFRFEGPHARNPEELSQALQLGAGAPYSSAGLATALKRVEKLYTTRGHPYVLLDAREFDPRRAGEPGSTWNEDHTRVAVLVKITEGPEVRFGPILIRGNFRTADAVIRADLPFKTGDLFDVTKVGVAEANLNHHNLFNGPRVTPYGLSERANPVPILVEVQERFDDWGTPLVTAGYSTDIGLSESIGYGWGNVAGGGGSFELKGEAAEDFRNTSDLSLNGSFWRLLQASLRYVHPHLGVPSLRGEVQLAARKESTVRLGEIISYGLSLSLSWVPSPRLRLFGRYDLTRSSQSKVELQRIPGPHDGVPAVPDETITSKITLGAIFDDRVSEGGAKNPLLPAQGWLVGATAAAATKLPGLDTSHNFLVFSTQLQRYQPLDRKPFGRGFTLIANLRGDWGVPLGDEQALPAVERFFGGGDNTTRGFDTDKLKTEILRGDVSPAPPSGGNASDAPVAYRIIPQGGNIRFLATVEVQFPIASLLGYPWVGAVFTDAGTIFDKPGLVTGRDLKASIGLSLLRILTPVGPISLEYAYPLTQSLAEQQWQRETSPLTHWPGRIHFNWGIPILR